MNYVEYACEVVNDYETMNRIEFSDDDEFLILADWADEETGCHYVILMTKKIYVFKFDQYKLFKMRVFEPRYDYMYDNEDDDE